MSEEHRIIGIEEIKSKEIAILDKIVEVCEKNKLKYFIAYGTLLGAVRHKGFIPWDDDIDLLMPRKDYQKLLEVWDNEGAYQILECTKDFQYVYPFAKVIDAYTVLEEYEVDQQYRMGVYVDIFPYDGIKGSIKKNKAFLKICEIMEKLRIYSMFSCDKILHENPKKNFGRKFLWRILTQIGPAKISRWQNKFAQKYIKERADFQGFLCTCCSRKELLPAELFDNTIMIEFEGKKYCAPAQFDEILKREYGDYMKFPPKEQQHLTHNFKAWEVRKKINR